MNIKTAALFLFVGLLVFHVAGCRKDIDDDSQDVAGLPVLTTYGLTYISENSAIGGGNINSDNGLTVTERGVCWSTHKTPTKADNRTSDGEGSGSFSSTITGLTPNTTYYFRAYATNKRGTGYGITMSFTTLEESTFLDTRDGNKYRYVIIGNQVWMAENLKYLPSVTGPDTGSYTQPHYYVYDHNNTDVNAARASVNYETYGVLYNLPAALTACPSGWRLPSDMDWEWLTSFLGGKDVAGGKLKETGTIHWFSPNLGATDETGFTALPGGARYYNSIFNGIGGFGYWWSSTKNSSIETWSRTMESNAPDLSRTVIYTDFGISIRCIRN